MKRNPELEQWLAMLMQLRFISRTPVPPGDCQSLLDYLVDRECGTQPLIRLRHSNTQLTLEPYTARQLYSLLPEWAHTHRLPASEKNHPIFLQRGRLVYLDGRRRINKWFRESPDTPRTIWVIREI